MNFLPSSDEDKSESRLTKPEVCETEHTEFNTVAQNRKLPDEIFHVFPVLIV